MNLLDKLFQLQEKLRQDLRIADDNEEPVRLAVAYERLSRHIDAIQDEASSVFREFSGDDPAAVG